MRLARAARPMPGARPRSRAAATAALAVAGMSFLAPHQALARSGLQAPPAAPPSVVERVAVFGTDDRIPVPSRYARVADSIGLFFSNQSRTVCSAFCVAPNIIATAAHCLAPPGGGKVRLSDYTFARGYDRLRDYARIEGHATGSAAQSMIVGDFQHRIRPPIDAANDWALIRLNRAACPGNGLPVTPLSAREVQAEAAAGNVFQLSYHRDWTLWRIAYSRPCTVARDFKAVPWSSIGPDFLNAEQMLLHHCDTGGASSGSPLLLDRGGVVSVIGINVGTYVQSKVLSERGQVTLREKAETVANTAVNAAVFAGRIELLRNAAILAGGRPIRDLQQRLLEQRLYTAKVDGSYGPVLRSAIEGYERLSRLPVTGLATEDLLQRLTRESRGLGEIAPTSAPPGTRR